MTLGKLLARTVVFSMIGYSIFFLATMVMAAQDRQQQFRDDQCQAGIAWYCK